MPRLIPEADRRIAEEAVRRGLVAAIVMEQGAREWSLAEDDEAFPAYLVRREVLSSPQIEELVEAIETPEPDHPVDEDDAPKAARPPSEVIPGYRILERLGRGGMGSVYRAEQVGMKRTVALKILRRPLARDPQQVERLRREARLVGSLNHPNIVRGLDVGQHGPYHYFAMEHVEGQTLRDRLKSRGAMPEAEALRILTQVAEALDHAHSRGVIHRDVKPGNIMLTPDGLPKLTDYGLAKGPTDFTLTQSGVTIGTPQYISPEQARDPAGVDIQTDLYSLGATAYHMVTGIPPHTGDTLAAVLTKVLYEQPRTARQVNARVSTGASFLIEKLMAKQQRYRYQSPRELVRDLRALEAGRSIVPRDWAGNFEAHEERRRFRRAAAVGVAAVVVLAAGFWWNQHLNEQQLLELSERAAVADLDDLQNRSRPASELEWQSYIGELERLRRDNPGTSLETRVPDLIDDAEKHIDFHKQADLLWRVALQLKSAGKYVEAIREIEEYLPVFEAGGLYGARPLQRLRGSRQDIEQDGIEAAELRVEAALAEAEGLAAAPGITEIVLSRLEGVRDEIVETLVVNKAVRPVAALEEIILTIRKARGVLNDSHFANYWKEKDVLLKAGEFARLLSILDTAKQRIAADQSLKSMLMDVPKPVREELETIDFRERLAIREANGTDLESVMVAARSLADDGQPDEGLRLLEDAVARSAEDLRSDLQTTIDRILEDKARQERQNASRVREVYATLLEDLGRRDYFQARKRLQDLAQGVDASQTSLVTAVDQGQRLAALLEEMAFSPLRRRVVEGVDFEKGLRFGGGQPHPRVVNVRMKRSSGGDDILVFDAPGQKSQEGYLRKISLDLLLHYSDLAFPKTDEQLLANATLQIVEGNRLSRSRVENARSNLLKVDGDALGLESVIEALERQAQTLIDDKVEREKDNETTAAEWFENAEDAINVGEPKRALAILNNLLAGTVSTTEFVRNRRRDIEGLMRAAERLLEEQKIQGLYPGAIVTEGEETTKIEWSFSRRKEMFGFLPPEDGKARLYRVMPDDADSVGLEPPLDDDQRFQGHLQFVKAPPAGDADAERRRLHDSPLTIPVPFRSAKYASVSFTLVSEDPLYTQISLWGNHIGVLTDDGRRMSGRGVYAWHGEDWRNPHSVFPDHYRHDYLERNPDVLEDLKDSRHFQFEKGVKYRVKVIWDKTRMTLRVDGREVVSLKLKNKRFYTRPMAVRLVTYTPCRIDNLVLEGVVDKQRLKKMLEGR